MGHRIPASVLSAPLLASSLMIIGCGCSKAAFTSTSDRGARSVPVAPGDVEVLLDTQPSRPFRVVGELQARRIESPASIVAMQARAAEEGLDGIYWIDCSKGARVCTAKGFVYDKVSPAMPEINARTAASDTKPTPPTEVANR